MHLQGLQSGVVRPLGHGSVETASMQLKAQLLTEGPAAPEAGMSTRSGAHNVSIVLLTFQPVPRHCS